MSSPIIITRKILLLFNTDNKTEIKGYYEKLNRWQLIVFKAANMVATHQFIQEGIKEMMYLREDMQVKLANSKTDELGILSTSKQNSTYQVLSQKFKGNIPTSILTSINQTIVKTFNEEKKEYVKGNRSLRTYRSNIPIPFQANSILNLRVQQEEFKKIKYFGYAFTLHDIPFKMIFHKDLQGNKQIMERFYLPAWIYELREKLSDECIKNSTKKEFSVSIIENTFSFEEAFDEDEKDKSVKHKYFIVTGGKTPQRFFMKQDKKKEKWLIRPEYKLCDSSIQIDGNRIYLLAVFQFKNDKFSVKPEIKGECTLDIDIPILVKVGNKEYSIGNKEEFLNRRIALQGSARRLQKAITFNNDRQNNRNHKLQALDRVKDAEGDYVKYKIHQYSRKLINIALKNRCGVLILKNQIKKEEEAKQDEQYLLRNWSYCQLKEKIIYKAAMAGIVVEIE